MRDDITEVLAEPLHEHPDGLAAALEEAAALITARVESWSSEVSD